MLATKFCNIMRSRICANARTIYILSNTSTINLQHSEIRKSNIFQRVETNLMIIKRFKKSKKKNAALQKSDDDDDDDEEYTEDEDEDELLDKSAKKFDFKVSSIRLDNIAKVGFGISRNKIEEAFYQSKIRVNGSLVEKKSQLVNEGDEIDLWIDKSLDNPDLIKVARLTIKYVYPTSGGYKVKLVRDRNLLIEDYGN